MKDADFDEDLSKELKKQAKEAQESEDIMWAQTACSRDCYISQASQELHDHHNEDIRPSTNQNFFIPQFDGSTDFEENNLSPTQKKRLRVSNEVYISKSSNTQGSKHQVTFVTS
jgi:hypothetical protein